MVLFAWPFAAAAAAGSDGICLFVTMGWDRDGSAVVVLGVDSSIFATCAAISVSHVRCCVKSKIQDSAAECLAEASFG